MTFGSVRIRRILFSGALFWGAFLLFSVQPLAGKRLLPVLGGSVGVWTACMLFFQVVLLCGYLLAHAGIVFLGRNHQPIAQILLLLLGLFAAPESLGSRHPELTQEAPAVWIFFELFRTLGFPLVVLSAGAPVLQAWYSWDPVTGHEDPYPLYSASNLGCLAALIAYPLLIEPNIPLSTQMLWWNRGYLLLIFLYIVCMMVIRSPEFAKARWPLSVNWHFLQKKWSGPSLRAKADSSPTFGMTNNSAISTEGKNLLGQEPARPPELLSGFVNWYLPIEWVVLAFFPVSLMLGVTSTITMDLAPLPLLWVLPLAVYLLTYILAFSGPPAWRDSRWMAPLAVAVIGLYLPINVFFVMYPVWYLLLYGLSLIFVVGFAFHSELFKSRPGKEWLTGFYLCTALGGCLAGVFNGLVAPLFFSGLQEMPLTVAFGSLIFSGFRPRMSWSTGGVAGAVLLWLAAICLLAGFRGFDFQDREVFKLLFLAGGLLVVALGSSFPRIFGGLFCAMLWFGNWYNLSPPNILAEARSFYGVYRVRANWTGTHHFLMHGHIHHGGQKWVPVSQRKRPFYYYIREGPVGGIFREIQRRHGTRIGVVGLGVGTLAGFLRPWQEITFFEIDPLIASLAQNKALFTFLGDCVGSYSLVIGDARISLKYKQPGKFDLLVLDAYSSDSIPIHLLTREALALYLQHLSPGGILAFHISHRYLDLEPVVGNLVRDAGCVGYSMVFLPKGAGLRLRYDDEDLPYVFSSHWVVIARTQADLSRLVEDGRWKPIKDDPARSVWSDDATNVLACYTWE